MTDPVNLIAALYDLMQDTYNTTLSAGCLYTLASLAESNGRTVATETLVRRYDDYAGGSTNAYQIRSSIRNLRRRLEKYDAPLSITSVRGIGYKLHAPQTFFDTVREMNK